MIKCSFFPLNMNGFYLELEGGGSVIGFAINLELNLFANSFIFFRTCTTRVSNGLNSELETHTSTLLPLI